jgi:hypothetical protein
MQATRTEETKTKRARSPATKAKEEEKNKTPATKAKEEKDKTKRSIKRWNLDLKHKDNLCTVDLRRSARVLAAELEKTTKEHAAKLRRAALKKKKDAAKLAHTNDSSTDDTTTQDTTTDESSVESVASSSSLNPSRRKKTRESQQHTSTFGTMPRFHLDAQQPCVKPRGGVHNCEENIHSHLPDELLKRAQTMSFMDEELPDWMDEELPDYVSNEVVSNDNSVSNEDIVENRILSEAIINDSFQLYFLVDKRG